VNNSWQTLDLPIIDCLSQLKDQLSKETTLLLNAPPGAGKSTIVPLALLGQSWLGDKKIIMLEPRRLAARSIAARLSELLGEEVGNTVGYRIRFETRISEKTRIEVVTEGILTRMLQSDNSLDEVGLVIFDEFHERSIHADVALALCRESQQILRPDLRILVMSATLNLDQLTRALKAPLVESLGRQYPVDIRYDGDTDERMLPELTAGVIKKAFNAHDGDVLVFLPGQGEIMKCQELLRGSLKGALVFPLFGQLPFNKQRAAILPDKEGRRKIILATSIAETSLTIEGVKIVVDTGFGRTQKWDPKSGLSRLETIRISKDSADQRAGRAGRLGPGICYRMWSKITDGRLQAHRTPEIAEADLGSLALDLAHWGILNPSQLTWVTEPPKGAMLSAKETLHELGALKNGKITEHGKRMHQLPCHPRIAHMLLKAEEDDQVGLAADIAALIEERDPLGKEAGVDINERLEVLRKLRREHRLGGKWDRIEKVASSYRRLFTTEIENDPVDPFASGLLLTYAYPDRIASARLGNNAQFQLANGRIAMIGHKDDLAHEPWLAVAHLDARDGLGKIFLASPLNPRDLAERVEEREVIKWDSEDGGLSATLDLRIGNIILKSTPLPDPDPTLKAQAICDAVRKQGDSLLNWDEKVEQWQNRILCLKKWRPADGWPDVSKETLLATVEDWLPPYLTEVKNPKDLKRINLQEVLNFHLPFDLQNELNRLAPHSLAVPSGSTIQLLYRSGGEAPILAARLQELFGMAETPKVNDGTVAVLIHLLSPGYKPVQVTSDLRNFWNETYFEVRKELKRRYPKHSWPDDPWNAEAVRGVKRRS
jgi:ATP-dependent helicase HrpB